MHPQVYGSLLNNFTKPAASSKFSSSSCIALLHALL
jgi:hypothetical protein